MHFVDRFGMLWDSFGVPFGVDSGSLVSFRGLVVVLGCLGVSLRGRWHSWSLRQWFPGFSGKFWEPFWYHSLSILGTFCSPNSPSEFYWFLHWFCVDFGVISWSFFGYYWICFWIIRENAKTWKIARRPHESTKIEGRGVRIDPKIEPKSHWKLDEKLERKVVDFL